MQPLSLEPALSPSAERPAAASASCAASAAAAVRLPRRPAAAASQVLTQRAWKRAQQLLQKLVVLLHWCLAVELTACRCPEQQDGPEWRAYALNGLFMQKSII